MYIHEIKKYIVFYLTKKVWTANTIIPVTYWGQAVLLFGNEARLVEESISLPTHSVPTEINIYLHLYNLKIEFHQKKTIVPTRELLELIHKID